MELPRELTDEIMRGMVGEERKCCFHSCSILHSYMSGRDSYDSMRYRQAVEKAAQRLSSGAPPNENSTTINVEPMMKIRHVPRAKRRRLQRLVRRVFEGAVRLTQVQ